MKNFSMGGYRRKINVTYIGKVASSAKLEKSQKKGYNTYGIYLAPADTARKGVSVCPNCKHCKEFCLNGSGQARADILSGKNIVIEARKRRTIAYLDDRRNFSDCVAAEIESARKSSQKKGIPFSVRLNCTSDISPATFIGTDNQNLLERFPDVQFYDYTKVPEYLKLQKKYKNYDLTFSYDGHNWDDCEYYLRQNGRVAVVFRDKLPVRYRGIKVINGNEYDMRFLDPIGVIIGLSFHTTARNYSNGTWNEPPTDFVVPIDDPNCEWS